MTNKKGDNKETEGRHEGQDGNKTDTMIKKKGNKRKQKGDKTDTMTHKKGDKTGDEERMKRDKVDTVTNKKGNKERQAGRKADTLSGSKADTLGKHLEPPTVTTTCWGKTEITWETKEKKCCMASGKGRTPAVQAPNLGDKSKEITLKTNELRRCMASGNGRTPAVTETADTS